MFDRLAENDPVRALELLERWRALAVAQGRTGSLIPLQVLTALALAASGQEPAALTALADALALDAVVRHRRRGARNSSADRTAVPMPACRLVELGRGGIKAVAVATGVHPGRPAIGCPRRAGSPGAGPGR